MYMYFKAAEILLLLLGYIACSEAGLPSKFELENAKWLSLENLNTIPNIILKHIQEDHRIVQPELNFIHKKNLPQDYKENQEETDKYVEEVVRSEDSVFDAECDEVFFAYQRLIDELPKILSSDELGSSLALIDTEGYDVTDPNQLHELSCLIVSFARNDMYDNLPPEEKEDIVNAIKIYKLTNKYMEEIINTSSPEDLNDIQDEIDAIKALVNFYYVLEKIGFLPEF